MANTSTPKESAHYILRTFLKKFNNPVAGEMLKETSFLMTFLAKGLCEGDFETGLQYAIEKDWVKFQMPNIKLTQTGLDEANGEGASSLEVAHL